MAESLVFDVFAKDAASKVFDKIGQSSEKLGGTFSKVSGGLHAVGKAAAVGAAAGIGILGVVAAKGFGELTDAQAGIAQTNAVLKSTGGVSKVTAKGVNDLASAIQKQTGQTDDSIVASENMLLTFTNIRNGVGKNNKIFDQATQASADMAQAMGGTAADQAVKLGKALNDPVKGVTALAKVGVTFTAAQKETIAAMVKMGDTAGAQKIILGELNTEFGGSAKAFGDSGPGQIAKAKRSFEDFSQTIATTLLPVVGPVLTTITTLVTAIAPVIQGLVEKAVPYLKSFADGFTRLAGVFKADGISGVIATIQTSISNALPGILAKLGEWGQAFIDWIGPKIPPMLAKLADLLQQAGNWVLFTGVPLLTAQLAEWGNAFVAWIGPRIGPMLSALGEMLAKVGGWVVNTGLPWLGQNLAKWGQAFIDWIGPKIGPMLSKLGELLASAGQWIVNTGLPWLGDHLKQWGQAFIEWVGPKIPPLLAELGKLIAKVGVWFVTDALPKIQTKLGEWAGAFIQWAIDMIPKVVTEVGKLKDKLIAWVRDEGIPKLEEKFKELAAALLKKLKDTLVDKWEDVRTFFSELPGKIKDAIGDLSTKLVQAGKDLMAGLKTGLVEGFKDVASYVGGLAQRIQLIKGPPAYDAVVLKDNGMLLMRGLGEGIDTGFEKYVVPALAGMAAAVKGKLTGLAGEITTTFDSFKSLASSVAGSGGLSGLGGGAEGDDTTTAARMISQLNAKVQQAAAFAADLITLKARGLNATAIAELANAGAAQGGAAADALSVASDRQIAVLNGLQGKLTSTGMTVGAVGSAAMYDAGVQSAQGLAKGFASQRKVIEDQMLVIAKAMQTAIKKALGIHSPSAVFEQLGEYVAQGFDRGVASGSPSLASVGAAGAAAGGSAGGTYIALNVTAPVGSNAADIGMQLEQFLLARQRVTGGRLAFSSS